MTVRQYIGARYVPIFSDPIQWSSANSYEPLTVVMNQGTSYVSKQSVPAGIQISNETYWLRWADYNAQLEEYIRQVQQYSGQISALNDALPIANFDSNDTVKDAIDGIAALLPNSAFDSVNTIDARFDDIEALLPDSAFDSVNTVDARFDAIEADSWVTTSKIANKAVTYDKIADTLRKKLITDDSIRNECIIMLGDSYAQGVGAQSASTNGNNWQDILVSLLGLTDVYKYKGGSAGFVMPSTSTSGSSSTVPIDTTYKQILDYAYTYINGLGRADEVKHIIIQGGWNDSNSGLGETDIKTAVNECIDSLRSHFPNAKIYIAATYCGSIEKTGNTAKVIVSNAYRSSCDVKGACFCETVNLPWLYTTASYDTVHPTNAMQNLIAGFIAKMLCFGYADDFEGPMADNYGLVTKNHELCYRTRLSATMESGTNLVVQADDMRSFRAALGNQDVVLGYENVTDSSAIGIAVTRFYIDGRIKLVYGIQSSGSLNGGDSLNVFLNHVIKFH